MDKRIIFSVAGSGKTTYIINKLDAERSHLIITYTQNNFENLRLKVIERFGYLPNNIKIYTYFSFIYAFCFKPMLASKFKYKIKGIYWNNPHEDTTKMNRENLRYYIHGSRRLYHNRLAKLFEIKEVIDDIKQRIAKYYDCLYIDEFQDFGGHDFNFIMKISRIDTDMILVGDFFQHTFDTSRDGATNKNLHKSYKLYINKLSLFGFLIDISTLKKSYRCSKTTCNFITDKIGIQIDSQEEKETSIIFVEDENEGNRIYFDNNIVKLFYQDSAKYNCHSQNWGGCKGEDKYYDVCIVLNKKTFEKYRTNDLVSLPEPTRNKLYVAFSRARNNVYLVPDTLYKKYKNIE